jgi:hypothetical protein
MKNERMSIKISCRPINDKNTLPKNIYFIQRKNLGGIPRCQLEGGSRK